MPKNIVFINQTLFNEIDIILYLDSKLTGLSL